MVLMNRLQEAILITSVIMVLLYPIAASLGVNQFSNILLSFGIVGIAISLFTLITKKLRWLLYFWIVGFFAYSIAFIFITIF